MKIRLRADVPLAFCLSGGVDSAALASIAAKEFNAKVNSFSIIDSDIRYNEEDNIMATVRDIGCENHLIQVNQRNPLQRLSDLIEYHDAPIATITYYTQSLITEAIHEKGYRVAFSGNSADELFTGYYDHFLLHLYEMHNEGSYAKYISDWEKNIQPLIRNSILRDPNLYIKNPKFREHVFDGKKDLKKFFLNTFQEDYIEESFCENLLRNRTSNELFHESIPVILHEEDLNSMFYSIENRSPYLDTNLRQFAYSIPEKHLIRDGYAKYVLRKATKGILNDKVRLDRRKRGFNASISSVIDLDNKDNIDYLMDSSSQIYNIIDRKEFMNISKLNIDKNYLSKFIFNFINAKIFLDKN